MFRYTILFVAAIAGVWGVFKYIDVRVAPTQELPITHILCVVEGRGAYISSDIEHACKKLFTDSYVERIGLSDDVHVAYYPGNLGKHQMKKMYQALAVDTEFRAAVPDFEAWWNALPIRQKLNKQGPQ